MYTRQQHDLAHSHHQHAQLHKYHAEAHHQQAQYHNQQAMFHQEQAYAHSNQSKQQSFYPNQPTYDERHTAYANQVSPVALVYQGQISPEAISSLREFQNPYANQPSQVPLSSHAAHATENNVALMRGHRF